MNVRLITTIVIILIISYETNGFRSFRRGHKYLGNLGEPNKTPHFKPLPPDEWFTQKLDHFNPTDNRTWQQRYFTNGSFYKKGGPVFLMIGGEGTASAKWMMEGAWIKYANEHWALCFQLEHRFYGKSYPTNGVTTDELKFLNSEQALADLAYFIAGMNEKYQLNENTKWIAFGGSYPGSLAAWLREKYPHLVHGAISSSGPLLAKADFREYYDVVVESLETFSDECVDSVKKSLEQVEILLKHMIGQRNLNDKFKLCDPVEKSVNNSLDISNLFEGLASAFAGVVQYNKDNSPHAKLNIDDVCAVMVNTTIGPPINRLAVVSNLVLENDNETCFDYKYDKMVKEMQEVSWTSKMVTGGARQWTYQTCTEFGFYQTSDNSSFVFGDRFPLDFFIKQCTDIYGKNFEKTTLNDGIQRTNINYGALHPLTTNVLYVHGSIDPWHALGLTKTNDIRAPAIYIEGTAHCANMYEPKDTDIPALQEARVKINNYISELLK